MMKRLKLILIYWLLIVLFLSGCTSVPTHFYTLAVPPTPIRTNNNPPIFIEIAPIIVPERLIRPQLVITKLNKDVSTELDILENERWSSPFNSELQDAFTSGLTTRLNAIDVSHSGRLNGRLTFRISIELRDFATIPGNKVQSTYEWIISRSDNDHSSTCQVSSLESIAPGIDGLVLGVQNSVINITNEIATHVKNFEATDMSSCGLNNLE